MIEDVIKKYNYPSDIAEFLKKIYPYLLEYFGTDKKEIIMATLLNTPIILGGSCYNVLKKLGMLEEGSDILKSATSVYNETYDIIYDKYFKV